MTARQGRAYDPVKRGLDVLFSGVGLVLLSPVIALVAWRVRKNLGSPVLFKQQRPGKDGEIFTLFKFRSMRDVNPAKGWLTDEDRLTPFGQRLRATSLDELPSLVNVLRGEMSIVGPRPLLVEYLPRYSPEQARRHEVRPGLTGLAQVKGRNALDWDERFALDVKYVDSRSPLLDLQIAVATITSVFKREGISQDGHVTMTPFQGSEATGKEHK